MSPATTITCPSCQKGLKGRPEMEGKKIRCPACGHAFVARLGEAGKAKPDDAIQKREPAAVVKSQAVQGKEVPPPAPPPPKPAHGDDDEEEGPDPYGVTGQDLQARCPNCASPMESEDAVVCLDCGFNTQLRLLGTTTKTIAHTLQERLMWLLPGLGSVLGMVVFILGCLYFCLLFPAAVKGSWAEIFDHESMRMWAVLMSLSTLWGLGMFATKRLIMHPTPPEKIKE